MAKYSILHSRAIGDMEQNALVLILQQREFIVASSKPAHSMNSILMLKAANDQRTMSHLATRKRPAQSCLGSFADPPLWHSDRIVMLA